MLMHYFFNFLKVGQFISMPGLSFCPISEFFNSFGKQYTPWLDYTLARDLNNC